MFKNLTVMGCSVCAAVSVGLAAFSMNAVADHSWAGYHWASKNSPFTLSLGSNLSSVWKPYLNTAAYDWKLSSVLDSVVVAGKTNPASCMPIKGRVEVCNAAYGSTGWLGIAQVWVSGTHITQAITKLNDTYFNTATYNKPAWRNMVTCQEVGHTLGLDHQDVTFGNANLGTCMDYTSNPAGPLSNEHPNKHDYDQLVNIYAHSESTTTVAKSTSAAAGQDLEQLPSAMTDLDFSRRGQWGRVIRNDSKGRPAKYELDFGGGRKIFTHVFWADISADTEAHDEDHHDSEAETSSRAGRGK